MRWFMCGSLEWVIQEIIIRVFIRGEIGSKSLD